MASKENYSVLYGSVSGLYNLTTSVLVSGSKINWTASVQYLSGNPADRIRVRVYDSGDSSAPTYLSWVGVGETTGATGTFSGTWNAEKTSGTVTFYCDFYKKDDYNYENQATVILSDNYVGATIYEAPTCAISLQSEIIYAGAKVSLRCYKTGGSITRGVVKRYYRTSESSPWTSTQIASGITSTTTISDTIPSNYSGGQVYWRYEISDGTSDDSAETARKTVISNTPPSAPTTLTIPSSISAETSFAISWTSSTDAEGNLAGYILERSIDGGLQWTQVYKGPALTITDLLVQGTTIVRYRVKAYDTYGAESSATLAPSSGDVSVSNNHAPSTPASPITISPAVLAVGAQVVISWGASSDQDGDSFNYVLERSVDNLTSYTAIYTGTSRNYADTVGSWTSVTYRVKAVDSHGASSGYLTAGTKNVTSNAIPTLVLKYSGTEIASESSIGTFSSVISDLTFRVNDADSSDSLTVKEIIDGVVKREIAIASANKNTDIAFSFQTTAEASSSYWNRILDGLHTITVSVSDGSAEVSKSCNFLKSTDACTITLTTAITSAKNIETAAVSICGNIPVGAISSVEVTADDGSHWESCVLASGGSGVTESGLGNRKKKATGALAEELLGGHYLFVHTMTNTGKKFNFRIQVQKVGGVGGYISSVQGTFTESAS